MKHQQQSIESMRALDCEQETQRLKLGDQLDVARDIDHFAYFAKKTQAEAVASVLGEEGYRIQLKRKRLTWELVATTESDVELVTVDAFVSKMYDLVQAHGGIYDGWGASVILKGNS